jgi:hypothetical protein
MQAVIDYCYEGNLEVEFRGQDNATRKWYHAPWLHPGPNGREFTHGLTGERLSRTRELAATQSSAFHNFAVGLYNAGGGYAIGRVWADPNHPDPSKAAFPEGTVAFKLLFTMAAKDQVPYLDGAPEWIADTERSNDANQIRNNKVRDRADSVATAHPCDADVGKRSDVHACKLRPSARAHSTGVLDQYRCACRRLPLRFAAIFERSAYPWVGRSRQWSRR